MTIYFYSRVERYGELSNFSPHGISMDGLWWPTVEHYFQAQKFGDPAWRERIRRASTPRQAKALGQTRSLPLRTDWDAAKDAIMLAAVRQKFRSHEALARLLLETGEEELAEASPSDHYWGVGQDGTGENRLGRILETVRAELRRERDG